MTQFSLQVKFGRIMLGWLLIGTLFIGVSAGAIILSSHLSLERARLARVKQRMTDGSAEVILKLQSNINDWGQWDEAYTFMATERSDWASSNIKAENLAGIGIDAMAFLDNDLSCRYGVILSENAPQFLDGGGEEFCRRIVPYLAKEDGGLTLKNRVVLLPGRGALAAAIAPVLHTDGSGPIIGYAVGATYIDSVLPSTIGDNTLPFSILRVDHPEDEAEYREAEMSITGPTQGLRRLSWTTNVLYGRLTDSDSSDGIIFRLLLTRDEFLAGVRDLWVLLMVMIAVNLLAGLAGIKTLMRFVLRPVHELTGVVNRVASGSGKSSEIAIHNNVELGALAQAVRAMVTKLEESRHEAEGLAYDLQKFRLAAENATDMIVIADADFSVIYASRSAATVSGYGDRELVGKGALLVWSYQDETQREAIRRELEAGRTWHGEVECHKKNGERYLADLNVAPVMDKQGQLVFSVSIQRDITQAKEVDRMKTEFVSMASHQLKTPLTGIKWFTETLMQEDSGFTPEQREFMHSLYEMNERMIRLVNDLLNVSRIESGRKFSITKALVDLGPVVQQAVAEQTVLAQRRGIKISVSLPTQALALMDAEKIRQVMHNLINNAVKYSRDGGEVHVTASASPEAITVAVTDDGIGIPESQRKRIFEKFFRAENVGPREGTGLGLYIVKAIIEGHGGQISFSSREKAGTAFTFTLPRLDNPPPASSLPKSESYGSVTPRT